MTIKHAKDTYSSLPIEPKASPFNSVDGVPCFAGKLTEPMPPHPMPVSATAGEDFTPEMWLEQQRLRRIICSLIANAYVGGRAAEGGLIPDRLNPIQQAFCAQAVEKRHAEIHAMFGEPDLMAADLAALRIQVVEPITTMIDEQLAQIENEKIGAEFSEHPWEY